VSVLDLERGILSRLSDLPLTVGDEGEDQRPDKRGQADGEAGVDGVAFYEHASLRKRMEASGTVHTSHRTHKALSQNRRFPRLSKTGDSLDSPSPSLSLSLSLSLRNTPCDVMTFYI
jgi:hypothetical protein